MQFSEYWYPAKGTELAEQYALHIVGSSLCYPLILLGIKYVMKERSALQLKWINVAWNLLLALGSLAGWLTILISQPEILLHIFYPEQGFTAAVRCVTAVFTLTKCLEYGDTVLLLLKKRNVILLHWYHHLSVTLYCWDAQRRNVDFGHLFAFINLIVHSIMYGYYAISTSYSGVKFLRKLRPYITMLQLVQMFVGIFISSLALLRDDPSHPHFLRNAQFACIMYLSYAYLFGKFYIDNYLTHLDSTQVLMNFSIILIALPGGIWALVTASTEQLIAIMVSALLIMCISVMQTRFWDGAVSVRFMTIMLNPFVPISGKWIANYVNSYQQPEYSPNDDNQNGDLPTWNEQQNSALSSRSTSACDEDSATPQTTLMLSPASSFSQKYEDSTLSQQKDDLPFTLRKVGRSTQLEDTPDTGGEKRTVNKSSLRSILSPEHWRFSQLLDSRNSINILRCISVVANLAVFYGIGGVRSFILLGPCRWKIEKYCIYDR